MGFSIGVITTVMVGIIFYLFRLERKNKVIRDEKKERVNKLLLDEAVYWVKRDINIEYQREGMFSKEKAKTILNTFSYYHPAVSIIIEYTETGVDFILGIGDHSDSFTAPYDIPRDYLIHNRLFSV